MSLVLSAHTALQGLDHFSCCTIGYYQCSSAVRIARPGTKEELADIVGSYDLVKGVGVGHRSAGLFPHTLISHGFVAHLYHLKVYGHASLLQAAPRNPTACFAPSAHQHRMECNRRPRALSGTDRLRSFSSEAPDGLLSNAVHRSWWQEQFCAGNSSSAVGIVLTELNSTKAL